MKKLISCVLVALMIFGTCTTTFAAILPEAEVNYVKGVVADVRAEIDEIIEVAKNGTDDEKLAKIDEAVEAVKGALVTAGYNGDELNAIEAAITAEIIEIIAIAENGELGLEDKVDAYVALVKGLLDLSAEEEAFVDDAVEQVKDEVEEIIVIVETEDEEAAKEKINAYVDFLKEVLGVTAEDEAKIAEIVADVAALVEEIKGISEEDVKAVIDGYIAEVKAELALEYAKLGHKHYEATEDSKYVAIGADTVAGTGISRTDATYYDLVADEYDVDNAYVAAKQLFPTAVLPLISGNEAVIADADLITYQTDASGLIYAVLLDTPNWDKYVSAEAQALISEVWAQAEIVLAADWEAVGNAAATDLIAEIKAAVLANIPEGITVTESNVDAVIAFCTPYIEKALEIAEEKKDEVVAAVPELDPMVVEYAEKLAYAVVSYVVETNKAIEEIQAINPEATLLVAGMYNPAKGLVIETAGAAIDAEEIFEYVIEITNIYYTALAVANGDFAFVDVSDADTNGFASAIDVTTLDVNALAGTILAAGDSMHANAAGHAYIKDQIVKALTCDYSTYEQLDETNHYVVCSICGDKYKEAHSFDGNTCEYCGYVKTSRPSGPSGLGGGGVASSFLIKFETNGGSKVESVRVKRNALLEEPAAPTKDGFTFAGWYTDKALTAKYDFSTPVTKSFTLYANWAKADVLAKFTDIDANAWYYEYVKQIVELGYMNGISETEFAPNATLTRGMFVTVLHRIEGTPAVEAGVEFADVAADQYYAEAVKWASANGIVKGISETEFAPNADVTREQMAAMIARYADYKEIEVAVEGDVTYTDSEQISEYAKDAVKVANKLGILIGNADGSFAPKRNATRAEAAALFVRLLGVLEK